MSNPLEDAKKDVDHFYTTNPTGELAPKDYMYEGIAGYVYLTPRENRIPIYRFWNGKIVDHFYTESQAEALKVVADLKDYKLESMHAWYSPESAGGAFVEFKRYYWDTPYYDHFYTANQSGTADTLEDKAAVQAEGKAGYIYPVSEGVCECTLRARDLYPLYRWCRPLPLSCKA